MHKIYAVYDNGKLATVKKTPDSNWEDIPKFRTFEQAVEYANRYLGVFEGDFNYVVNVSTVYHGFLDIKDTIEIREEACKHEKERTTNLGRCFNRYTCLICGRSVEIDSGD